MDEVSYNCLAPDKRRYRTSEVQLEDFTVATIPLHHQPVIQAPLGPTSPSVVALPISSPHRAGSGPLPGHTWERSVLKSVQASVQSLMVIFRPWSTLWQTCVSGCKSERTVIQLSSACFSKLSVHIFATDVGDYRRLGIPILRISVQSDSSTV